VDGRCHDNCTTTLELIDSLYFRKPKRHLIPRIRKFVFAISRRHIRTEGQIAQKGKNEHAYRCRAL